MIPSADRHLTVLLRCEGLLVMIVAVAFYAHTSGQWGLFALLFLAPDLSFFGYLGGARIGAWCYNTLHTYLGPLTLLNVSWLTDSDLHVALALIWIAHIGFDRALGYGLKSIEGFSFTHLGPIGKRKVEPGASADRG